jgi:hypothetical protein
MKRTLVLLAISILAAPLARGEEPPAAAAKHQDGDKRLSGMSIVGNDDAPKSLVIVPWKSAGLGDALAVGSSLGDGRGPVDRDVFMRELDYYRIRAASSGAGDAERR